MAGRTGDMQQAGLDGRAGGHHTGTGTRFKCQRRDGWRGGPLVVVSGWYYNSVSRHTAETHTTRIHHSRRRHLRKRAHRILTTLYLLSHLCRTHHAADTTCLPYRSTRTLPRVATVRTLFATPAAALHIALHTWFVLPHPMVAHSIFSLCRRTACFPNLHGTVLWT